MKTKIALLIIFLIKSIKCLKSDQVCSLRTECLESNCSQQARCKGEYAYECKANYCAIDKDACIKYKTWNTIFSKIRRKLSHEQQMSIYINFNKEVKPCPSEDAWLIENVCVNMKKCAYKPQIWSLRYKKVRIAECACKGKLSHKCNTKYCSLDQQTCELFNQNSSISILKCNN